MQNSSKDIRGYLGGCNREQFGREQSQLLLVAMCFIILGEATRYIQSNYRPFADSYPQIPWLELVGLRNFTAHACYRIDIDGLWDAIEEYLPELEQILPNMMRAAEQWPEI
ncbi:MAG: DUF86 domain-containing protein [Candidatus Symbiobacter sp.]|nr:DUF86 domain-containing protein [Candidatus Symbiobacter sp.]